MNTLTIDIGNSCIKIDTWGDNGILSRETLEYDSSERIAALIDKWNVEGAIIASVRNNTGEWVNSIKRHNLPEVVGFTNEEIDRHYSDKIHYQGKIGVDRVAAWLGAEAIKPERSKLIIDLGTAITLDISDKNGDYQGGNISLGMSQRLHSLNKATRLLPKIDGSKKSDKQTSFGGNTEEAILFGVKNAITGEILYSIEKAKQEYEMEWVIATGGDSENFKEEIRETDNNLLIDKFLVGRGLNYHLRRVYYPETFRKTNFQLTV